MICESGSSCSAYAGPYSKSFPIVRKSASGEGDLALEKGKSKGEVPNGKTKKQKLRKGPRVERIALPEKITPRERQPSLSLTATSADMESSSSDISASAASSDTSVSAGVAAPHVLEQRDFLPHDQFEPYDAKGDFVNGHKFQEEYHATIKHFNENDENSLRFFKNIRIDNMSGYGRFCPRGVELVGHVDNPTLWDAYIRKVPHAGHQDAVTQISGQLFIYALQMERRYPSPRIAVGGGLEGFNEAEDEDGNVHPERRGEYVDPDCMMRVKHNDDLDPRVIIEVEFSNRTPFALSEHVQKLMKGKANLRCVIGMKFYQRNEEGNPFAAVCFVWKKLLESNQIYIDRVFDFGPKASAITSKSFSEIADFWTDNNVAFTNVQNPNGANPFEVTPVPAPGIPYNSTATRSGLDNCSDTMVRRHCTVTIAMADVYYGYNPIPVEEEGVVQEDHQTDVEIDLYKVLREIDVWKAKNFSHPSTQKRNLKQR